MTEADKPAFRAAWRRLAIATRRDRFAAMDEEAMREELGAYFDVLARLQLTVIQQAAVDLARSCTHMPTAAEWYAAADALRRRQRDVRPVERATPEQIARRDRFIDEMRGLLKGRTMTPVMDAATEEQRRAMLRDQARRIQADAEACRTADNHEETT